ncbi:hypothetical protein [Mycobacterium colombiense]|uniref:hypothetical protein n=1 Tax=Mycobacterium colombiense TaxID=339268 RepID=UPI0012DB6B9F|nr:hypothetical protein [Mycobacterium colombiense]
MFGENENDTKVIAELLVALCPDLEGMVQPRRRPPILMRDCHTGELPDKAQIIARLIDAENQTSEVVCVFAHEDCDNYEPAHSELSERIENSFRQAGYHVHAVTPAWETETWLFQWPAAIAAYRQSWRSIEKFSGKDVGRIANAKEELTRSLRPQGKATKYRDYRESDAPEIAKIVRQLGIAGAPSARSASYDRFRECVAECCERIRT